MKKIIIENLKSINRLEFDIPSSGVHVLTGANGSGKTSLLTCLNRLTDSYAFQRHFKTSSNNQFDNFQNAKITYQNGASKVSYAYGNTRWSPTPKSGASILLTLGFNQAVFISSGGERFYVQDTELNTVGISAASIFLRSSMNEIFETTKYSDLRRKKLDGKGRGPGRWNYGFLMPAGNIAGQNRYYTEKNFSLGEILILNALFQLENISNNSLVLIDEIELALHPRVQVKFLHFLEWIASQKQITIILSTHSSSLIKSASKLIYLERISNGNINVEYECYPAIALQNIAVVEEVQPDYVFFVEDIFGKYILEELLSYYFKNLYEGRKPICRILPVGGWGETIRFAEASISYLIPANTKVFAMLDQDVEPYISNIQAKSTRNETEQEQLNLYNQNKARTKFLPITPELGIVNLLNDMPVNHRSPLQDQFNCSFDISQIIINEAKRGIDYSANPRKSAKIKLHYYIEKIKEASNRDSNYVRINLAGYYAMKYCPSNHGAMRALLNPIFH